MSNKIAEQLANIFTSTPLPVTVAADLCAVKAYTPHRTGTNLMTVVEARDMLTSMLEKLEEQYDDDAILELAEESRRGMEGTWDLTQFTIQEVYDAGFRHGFKQALGAYDA